MPLEEIVHRVEARFLDISRALIQADPASDAREELECLRAECDRDESRLAELRGQMCLLAQRLEDNQQAAALLPSQIESSVRRGKSSQAMRQALELEGFRRAIGADQEETSRLEHSIWCLEFRLRQLQRRMQRLSEGLAR